MPAPHFALLLRRLRKDAGLTQQELADRARISPRSISELERGTKHVPRPDTLRLLADALALDPATRLTFEAAARERDPPVESAAVARLAAQPGGRPPRPPSPLIDREQELAAIITLLQKEETQLLTLTGTGGVGKTRLALEVAQRVVSRFPDGVSFLPLAPVRDARLVLATIMYRLEIGETSTNSVLALLIEALGRQRRLLVLDNLEQVAGVAGDLGQLLAACPGLTILATSRSPLHLSCERLYPLDPLPVSGVDEPCQQAGESPAVRLFVARAQMVQPHFVLSPENTATVTEICRRLDGLPLAIELAAARVGVLPLPTLLGRLTSRLQVLTGGPRDLAERQQTLRATLGWSYDLLSAPERELFARLSVFAGGCDLEAAEAVCGDHGDVLEEIASLVEQSLLRQVGDQEPRFTMLETIRDYAAERLEERGEEDQIRQRQARYYTGLVEEARVALRGPEQQAWLERLEREHDNLRAVLSWALDHDEESALRVTAGLIQFWHMRGHWSEGRQWSEAALERTQARGDGTHLRLRTDLLNGAGSLASQQGDYEQARQLHTESLALQRELEDKAGIARSLNNLGILAYQQGDYEEARSLYAESLTLMRELGDKGGVARSLNNLGLLAEERGEHEQARVLFEEGLAFRRESGDKRGISLALHNLGLVAQEQGEYDRARALHLESLELRRELGAKWDVALSLANLGTIAEKQGDFERAWRLHLESLAFKRELGDKRGVADSCAALAVIAGRRSYTEAAQLAGAAARIYQTIAARAERQQHQQFDRAVQAAREHLTAEEYAAAWAKGQAMSWEELCAYVLEDEGASRSP